MTDEWSLDNLPSDVLLLIFGYCHAFDLVRLSEVCRRFNDLIAEDILWFERRAKPLATNQASKRFRDRCNTILCLRTRWHVSENWQRGKYAEKILHSWEMNTMPWIYLTKETLWWSGGNQLCAFRRRCNRYSRPHEPWDETDKIFNRNNINSDISKFVVRNQYVISGHRDGHITFWSKSTKQDTHSDLHIQNAHTSNINAIDEISGTIISGSANGTVKLWSQPLENVPNFPLATIDVLDRVWSLSADRDAGKVAVGSSGHHSIPPLKIFDLECCSESILIRHRWRRGAGIYDMLWENSNILLTCGYDTCVRKWDTRTGSCVATWSDPTDAALYCLSSDYRFTIVTGTQYNCKAVLWDQRMTKYVQLFFLTNVGRKSSPLYSISFDSSSFYGATDRRLIELTFSGYDYCENDYKKFLCSQIPQTDTVNGIR
ncbi:F-box/WD repeat-containing protein 4 [Venturia canescens]|uniref:F-box/WD repeat-containing protein 4 n=1 Tax=Venturia canescens TaxID=32260 RepID=UPI001C9C0E0B|nr:F-box/WD repeat-containing protein 4 [Venturia canescens]